MTTANDIIAEARKWEYVHYEHMQSSIYGCDCVGFLILVAKNLGLLPQDFIRTPYSADWHLHQGNEHFIEGIEALGGMRAPLDQLAPGMIALFRYGNVASHAGILLPDDQIIHADVRTRRVIRHSFYAEEHGDLVAAYHFPGVAHV